MSTKRIPFLQPHPPKLSELTEKLKQIEKSGTFTNFGPANSLFERELKTNLFGPIGECLTVCNATTGLMLALKHATFGRDARHRLVLMPSFTFAAAAQAVIWAGLTPLFCDIDEALWAMSPTSAERLLESYGSSVAVIFPYATFGTDIDLDHYRALSLRYGIPVVIDAAASLGTCSRDGQGFGTGFPYPIVFSMHATKAFATAEAGLIYCADPGTIQALRAMSNFGFDDAQSVSMPGLNAKLNEFTALMALEKLRNFDAVMTHRTALAQAYRAALPECVFQVFGAQRQAFVFMPVLLPEQHATGRANILQLLEKQGIGARKYFSPHLALHPYLKQNSMSGDLTTTDMIARRIISLPMSDLMTIEDVQFVCNALRGACNAALL